MYICLRNNPAIFHPDLFWNDSALRSFWRGRPNKNNNMNNDMNLVPELKITNLIRQSKEIQFKKLYEPGAETSLDLESWPGQHYHRRATRGP